MATFHEINSPNILECPICLTLFNHPKPLTCSHTFCKDCLEIFQTQSNQRTLTCPVCRKETPVPSGDVDKIQTNVPLSSLVDEMKNKSPTCTVCETVEKSPAVSYCQDCGDNMCESCEKDHSNWKRFSNHKVVAMKNVVSGKVPLKRRQKCKKHPSEYKEYFCLGCREYVCFRCGMLEQSQKGHTMVEASVHEEKVMGNIKYLKEKAKFKKTTVEQHMTSIESQCKKLTNLMRKLNDDVDRTYEEYMKLLSESKKALKCQLKRWSKKFEKELQVMGEESRQIIRHMYTLEELIANGMKEPLEKDALLAHDMLCKNLESILGRDDPDDQSPKSVTERAQKISFRKDVKVNELCLGEFEGYPWDLNADVKLPSIGNVSCSTAVRDGRIAVGMFLGGVHLYSPRGELQETVLTNVQIRGLGFLSDGRSVVRHTKSWLSLYTSRWEKLKVVFHTMTDGWPGGLTVDGSDNIYVGYMRSKKIQVFTPKGGIAVREMICDGYSPWELFSFQTTGKLILTDRTHVVCLDRSGKKENVMMKEGMLAYPAVCRDDSVIVALVQDGKGLVSIDRYARECEHVQHLITDFKLRKLSSARGCYLQEFQSGEIALCTSDRLYIFHGNNI